MKCSKKCKIRAIYRPNCKKLRKILIQQVCLHRIIQGINPRLILKLCLHRIIQGINPRLILKLFPMCVTNLKKYNKGENIVLKVKQTNHSSNLTMRSR